MKNKINLSPFLKKTFWLPVLIIVFGYTACRWDYHVSNYMFEKICNDPDKVGLFVYERVRLGPEYLKSIPKNAKPGEVDPRFVIDEKFVIDQDKFDEQYSFTPYEHILVSDIGPIFYSKTTVVRKADNKILSQAISVRNRKGWLSRFASFGYDSDTCPSSLRKSGLDASEYTKLHETIIKQTFTIK